MLYPVMFPTGCESLIRPAISSLIRCLRIRHEETLIAIRAMKNDTRHDEHIICLPFDLAFCLIRFQVTDARTRRTEYRVEQCLPFVAKYCFRPRLTA